MSFQGGLSPSICSQIQKCLNLKQHISKTSEIQKSLNNPSGWVGQALLGIFPNFLLIQGVSKQIRLRFCLISRQPNIGFSNRFPPLKTVIHTQI